MVNKTGSNMSTSKLPEDVRGLIIRKLRMLRQEHNRDWQKVVLAAGQELRGKISDAIFDEGIRGRWISIVRPVYRNLATEAITVSKEWPKRVWDQVSSTLLTAKVWPLDADVLEEIVDEYAWHYNKPPFTLEYIEAQKVRNMVKEADTLSCFDMEAAFGRWYDLEVTACLSNIKNEARWAREAVSIAIDEFVIAQRQSVSQLETSRPTVKSFKQENRKLATQDMYKSWHKKYLELKKKHPNFSDVDIAENIAKLAIAQGKSAGYIRKNMLKKK